MSIFIVTFILFIVAWSHPGGEAEGFGWARCRLRSAPPS